MSRDHRDLVLKATHIRSPTFGEQFRRLARIEACNEEEMFRKQREEHICLHNCQKRSFRMSLSHELETYCQF
jgi:hypothetical protein